MIDALSSAGHKILDVFLRERPLLAFDIDGTLAPIVAHPPDARLPATTQAALSRLSQRCSVAIVTGRGLEDARKMLAFAPRYVIGNHGAEGVPGSAQARATFIAVCRSWRAQLEAPWLDEVGALLEDKLLSLSLHYRHAPDRDVARAAIGQHVAALTPPPRVIEGKCVVNLIAPNAPDKGDAARALLTASGSDRMLYAGDDDTDEAVFALELPNLLGVRVGEHADSAAALFLRQQSDMSMLLDIIEQALPDARR